MKKLLILLLNLNLCLPVIADSYGIYSPDNYSRNFNAENGERLLFILDLSNSMNEPLENDTKYNLMIKTMREILPKINPNTQVGLRIYGHRMGFTPMEACRATTLAAPIGINNGEEISYALQKHKPKGMTPITFSLKQALDLQVPI